MYKDDPIQKHLRIGRSEYRLLSKQLWENKKHSEAIKYYTCYLCHLMKKDNYIPNIVQPFHPNIDKSTF